MKTRFFVITHKKIDNKWPSTDSMYIPLQVGAGEDINGYIVSVK